MKQNKQQYKQDWVVRLKKQDHFESAVSVVDLPPVAGKKHKVPMIDTNNVPEVQNDKSAALAMGMKASEKTKEVSNINVTISSLNEKLKAMGWWKATRNNDIIHLTRIINEPEFQDTRNKLQLL